MTKTNGRRWPAAPCVAPEGHAPREPDRLPAAGVTPSSTSDTILRDRVAARYPPCVRLRSPDARKRHDRSGPTACVGIDVSKDTLDACFARDRRPPAWRPPAPEVRQLQGLVRRAEDLVEMAAREKGRLASPALTEATRRSVERTVRLLEEETEAVRAGTAAGPRRRPPRTDRPTPAPLCRAYGCTSAPPRPRPARTTAPRRTAAARGR